MKIEKTARAVFLLGLLYILFQWRDLFQEPPKMGVTAVLVMVFSAFGVLVIVRLHNAWASLNKLKKKGRKNG